MDHQSANSLLPLPIIDLPHKWNENGELIAGTSPAECERCRWSGEPEDLFRYARLTGRALLDYHKKPSKCAKCEILGCILTTTARNEGVAVKDGSNVFLLGSEACVTNIGDPDKRISHSIFIPAKAPRSDIDRYQIPRLEISEDCRLSEASSAWALERITECVQSHEHLPCQSKSDKSFLPTRLIDLQSDGSELNLRLEDHQSIPPGSPYVALSYCWGDYKPPCMTTPDTLKKNKISLDWHEMPRTFQDAAKFTLSLGIRYLWIDSICIIQGDKEDWQREAGKMFAVYKNSFVTLAALAGSDSTHGLRTVSMAQTSVPLAHLRLAQKSYTLYMRHIHHLMPYPNWSEMQYRPPLLSRAWTYQERMLSPRVIFFTESEMIYQCLGGAQCECGDTLVQTERKKAIYMQTRIGPSNAASSETGQLSVDTPVDTGSSRTVAKVDLTSINATESMASKIAQTWRESVVEEYSPLEVSAPRDRLAALGALAEQFQRVRVGEDYLAGLWSGTLLQDLLWYSFSPVKKSTEGNQTLQRPFSLPTWSWASLKGGACYHSFRGDKFTPKTEVVEAFCSYAENNNFGVLESSKLILRGKILACKLVWEYYDEDRRPSQDLNPYLYSQHEGEVQQWGRGRNEKNWHWWVFIEMDNDQTKPVHQQVYILELAFFGEARTKGPHSGYFLLLRRESEDRHIYTREGIVTFMYLGMSLEDESTEAVPFHSCFQAHSILTSCEIR